MICDTLTDDASYYYLLIDIVDQCETMYSNASARVIEPIRCGFLSTVAIDSFSASCDIGLDVKSITGTLLCVIGMAVVCALPVVRVSPIWL